MCLKAFADSVYCESRARLIFHMCLYNVVYVAKKLAWFTEIIGATDHELHKKISIQT